MPTPNIEWGEWCRRRANARAWLAQIRTNHDRSFVRRELQKIYDGPLLDPNKSAVGA